MSTYDVEHIDARFAAEDDAVIVTQKITAEPKRTCQFRFIERDDGAWQYVELGVASEHDATCEPSKKTLQYLLRNESVEKIYAADGERVLAEMVFDVENPAQDLYDRQ